MVAQQAWQQHSAVVASSPSWTNGNEHKDLPSNSTDPIAIKHPWDVLQQAWSTEAKIMLAVCVDSRCHHRTSSNFLCLYLDLFTLFYIRWYFCKLLLFPVVWFFFPHRKLLANQSASLQIIWQRSIYLLAKCVWGSINKSKYRENVLYSGLMEKKTWRIYCKYLCLFDRYFRINGM